MTTQVVEELESKHQQHQIGVSSAALDLRVPGERRPDDPKNRLAELVALGGQTTMVDSDSASASSNTAPIKKGASLSSSSSPSPPLPPDGARQAPCQPASSDCKQQQRAASADRPTSASGTCDMAASRLSSCASDRLASPPGLLYYNREPLRLKDFNAEVRAAMDVEQFASQAELLLDLDACSMDDIVERMLEKVMQNEPFGMDKLRLAREAIFIRGSSMLFARTIQGTLVSYDESARGGGGGGARSPGSESELEPDQSWLCALCNLAQISRRHMVIARLKVATNMGESAHEVRLFVLIVVPSQEKDTKREVETGRTFATMLTDAQFRHKLLKAPDELEFKALMMIKAQQLANGSKLRNRYKYMLNAALSSSLSSIKDAAVHGSELQPSLDSQSSSQTSNNHRKQHQLQSALAPQPSSKTIDKLVVGGGQQAAILVMPPEKSNADDDNNNNNNNHSSNGLGLGGGDDYYCLRFNKNPRTVGLFDLIEQSSGAGGQTKAAACGACDRLDSGGQTNGCASRKRPTEDTKAASVCWAHLGPIEFGKGFCGDFRLRAHYYLSDFKDAFVGPPRTIQKTISTIWFLYFGILLPTIAFSSLNTQQTHGHMGDLRKAIIGQAIGGLGFALFGGQPLVIIMTTAPLCLYTKVIHQMCLDYGFHFPAMYAAVGLWNGFFLLIYSLFGFSRLMKWCTRSTEEIFALFIVAAFVSDAMKDTKKNFKQFFYTPACETQNNQTAATMADNQDQIKVMHDFNGKSSRELDDAFEIATCRRETSLLFVMLMLGTLWLATTLYKFRKTPYLSPAKRDLLADYALPTAVIVMSYVGSFVFNEIYVERFPPIQELHFERAKVDSLPISGIITSLGLGFTLSLLFFMDQNISAAMVDAPQNRLKKGPAYHYDLFVVGILNGFLALYGLPMMHGVLPHSPLHVRSLADIEEHVEEGHVREVIVNCRETRVTAIVAHLLVLASVLLIPYPIAYIPRAVLNGLFLYMAVTSLDGLQMFERILLLFTEQNKYPPNHYIRRCPQRKIHQFTVLQLFQLCIMCLFGFSPINIVEMFFPVIIFLMIPFRHRIVPKYIGEKYLEALDGRH